MNISKNKFEEIKKLLLSENVEDVILAIRLSDGKQILNIVKNINYGKDWMQTELDFFVNKIIFTEDASYLIAWGLLEIHVAGHMYIGYKDFEIIDFT